MPKEIRNIGASVRARLLNLAKERNQPFDLLLTRFAHERLLYRLSISKHRERYVLKGAMLLTTWFDDPLRPTRDLDLLGVGDSDADAVLAAFREICAIEADDAVVFDIEGLTVDRVRDEIRRRETCSARSDTCKGARAFSFTSWVMPGRSRQVSATVLAARPVAIE